MYVSFTKVVLFDAKKYLFSYNVVVPFENFSFAILLRVYVVIWRVEINNIIRVVLSMSMMSTSNFEYE